MDRRIAKEEAERLLCAITGPGSVTMRSAAEKKLGRVLRALGPCRVIWNSGQPTVLVALAGDSMYGARRLVGYARRVG